MKDKILHFIISLLLCAVGMALIVYLWKPDLCFIAPLATLAIGIGKEVFDIAVKDATSDNFLWDFLADLFGTVAGCIIFLAIFFILK